MLISDSLRSPDQLTSFAQSLAEVVGSDHVLSSHDAISAFSRCTAPWPTRCSLVVFPESTVEVAACLRLARAFGVAVWPVSRGHNWCYGTTQALTDGALILHLGRMNRILEVNEELAYAVIEPGVSQGQLAEALQRRGGKLWADCTDSTPDGSVIGNALDRGVGYTPYGDHFGHLSGLEVVLSDGRRIELGGASQHVYRYGVGPVLDGLFSQSNFGIVTRATIWLMPAPQTHCLFALQLRHAADLPAVIAGLRNLALARVVSNTHVFNDVLFSTTLPNRGSDSCIPAPLIAVGGLYGSAAKVRADRKFVQRELAHLGRLQFLPAWQVSALPAAVRALRGLEGWSLGQTASWLIRRLFLGGAHVDALTALTEMAPIFRGVPSEFILRSAYHRNRREAPAKNLDPARDGCGLYWFPPIVPATAEGMKQVCDLGRQLFERHGFRFALVAIQVNPRAFLACMPIHFDREDEEETKRATQLNEALHQTIPPLGYPCYRIGLAQGSTVYARQSALGEVVARLKGALDPENLLAPGRYGIECKKGA
jgi:4-cresol dehydrogenase (hydroxylating)